MTAVYITAAVLAAIAAAVLIPIRLTAFVNADGGEIKLGYAFLKLTLYPRPKKQHEKKSGGKTRSDGEKPKEKREFDIKELIKIFYAVKDDFFELLRVSSRYLAKHMIKIRELNISARFGTGDPAYTGMLCGAVYPAVYNAVGFADRHMRLKNRSVELSPDFNRACFSAGAYIEISTNILHFIVLGALSLKYILRILKDLKNLRKEKDNG
ncbi:MAG TPA: DUF2953 domain-containing protein [Candidatus Ornithomonoglobus intestinigallinarum]|uniref:DUF2953 domain-containing protein n=1 Tax=Candidatus Ornithomonoglobus intestinigallinarum TaxID=2840894 RepID=A0A9D1H465_9FIRM|nr:DUF2953 domain-containing protein [Candidatus Ornithomonoglobus intestinigallinarum]